MAASTDYTDFGPGGVGFSRYRGETIELDIVVKLKDPVTGLYNPVPISNLSQIWFTAKLTDTAADPGIFQKTKTGGSIVATDDPAGKARITIDPADTTAMENITNLLCDVKVKEITASRETIELRGKLIIRPTPTRAIV